MRTFSLDMIPGGAQTAVACNQYEAGDVWVFALYYDGGRYSIPADADVSITGTKPDGAAYKIAGTVVDNAVSITVTDQITACAGRSIAEILVESETDGTTLYSANFPLLIEPAAVHGELSPSVIPTAIVDAEGNIYYEGKSIMGLYPVESASGDVAVIHDGAEGLPVRDLSVAIEPVQAGTGTPSPSNVRAITGWSAVKVARTRNNLLPIDNYSSEANGITFTKNADGTIKATGTATANAQARYRGVFLPAGRYLFGGCPAGGNSNTYHVFAWDYTTGARPTRWDGATGSANDVGTGYQEILVETGHEISITCRILSGTTVNDLEFHPIILAEVDAGTTWTPSEAEVTDITLPTTVYGGTLDVTTGILTVDRGFVTWNGSEDWVLSGGKKARCNIYALQNLIKRPASASEVLEGLQVSYLTAQTDNATYQGTIGISCQTNGVVGITLTGEATTADAVKAYLAEHPLQVVYPLAAPITYTLTPTEVKTLLGENRIYADAGRVTVQYRADFNEAGLMYIPKAPTADGSYRLTADVTGGTPTYRWEAAE